MGPYALGRAVEGAEKGVDKYLARREGLKESERADTLFEQGQEDRDYSLERQTIEDARTDKEYNIQDKLRDRALKGNEALRAFMLSGDLEPVNGFMDEYTPDGFTQKVEKSPDGGYLGIVEYDGKSEKKPISPDDIGTAMQLLITQDPYAQLEQQNKLKRESEATKGEREHDMNLLEREYELKYGLERIKNDGKGVTSRTGKSRPAYIDKIYKRAADKYGGKFANGIWSFDSKRKERMAASHSDLAGAYFLSGDSVDENAAHRSASRFMAVVENEAETQADKELDEGIISKDQYENRVADIMDHYVDYKINEMAPSPGQMLERGTAPGQDGGQPIPQQAMTELREISKGSSEAELQKAMDEFDEVFGPGAADRVLRSKDQSQSGGGPGGAVSDASLVRGAQAAEGEAETTDEEPSQNLTRSERRAEKKDRQKMSRKQHQQIALSEYKYDWSNMDGAEKLEWWEENSGALKARSPRSYRKAAKEISEIRAANTGRRGYRAPNG